MRRFGRHARLHERPEPLQVQYPVLMGTKPLGERHVYFLPASTSMSQKSDMVFVTNHTGGLILTAHDRDVRRHDVTVTVGITERSAQSVVADLVAGSWVLEFRNER